MIIKEFAKKHFTTTEVLDFALGSLRALGVSATTWAYEGQVPDSA